MALTTNDVNTALSTQLSDERLVFITRQCAKRIKNDGVGVSNEDYDDLMLFAIGSYLVKCQTAGGHGLLIREGIADVMAEYSSIKDMLGSFGNLPGGGYEGEYLRLLHSIVGFDYLVSAR